MKIINATNSKSAFIANNLIYIAFLSVFFHFVITAIAIVALAVFILTKTEIRRQIFAKKSHILLAAFCGFTILTASISKNFIGIACSVVFYLIMLIFYWARSVMTKDMLETALSYCCMVVVPLSLAVVVEKLLNIKNSDYRCQLWFFNANYMTAILAAVAIFCVYKLIDENAKRKFYFISLFACVLAMYLSGSMFAFVELFVGSCLLFMLRKKYIIFAGFFFVVFLGLVVLYFNPELFPRILSASRQTGKRIEIWEKAFEIIERNPIFGEGFLTYYHNALKNPTMYQTTHTHNFCLEPLLSFGIIGTTMIMVLLWAYLKRIIECKEKLANDKITTLILSLCGAVLIHAVTDMTMMWIQTGLLYALILAAIGIGERSLKELKDNSTKE